MKSELSNFEARRIALTAQGFNGINRNKEVNEHQVIKTIKNLGLLQIDSVNVLIRAQYMPLFSRLGPYDIKILDTLSMKARGVFFEYWGHEASLLPVAYHPLLRWRMARALQGKNVWRQLEIYAKEKLPVAQALLKRIMMEGPLAASDIPKSNAARGMWIWSEAKLALEWLFWSGQIAATHRKNSFERVYDLPERVLPTAVLESPTPNEIDARRLLLAQSSRALGIATAEDLRDYFRISLADAQLPMQQLVEEGTVVPVRVQGWEKQAYLYKDAIAGRKIEGVALLSPFDPLIWNRSRTERLFNFRYRLEIYTPFHKREYGYYVLPFMIDGELVARVDLKADRKKAILIVLSKHLEKNAPHATIELLELEINNMAYWLGLTEVVW